MEPKISALLKTAFQALAHQSQGLPELSSSTRKIKQSAATLRVTVSASQVTELAILALVCELNAYEQHGITFDERELISH
jgi:hypothetical protein